MMIVAMDDERLALLAIQKAIREVSPDAEVYGFQRKTEMTEFLKEHKPDVAFLDIQMRGVSGIEIAKLIKLASPRTNIIFATGFSDFQGDALALHCSGYLLKPITAEKIRVELDNLRFPVACETPVGKKRIRFHTFGNFDVYLDGVPMHFKYDKSKELLAYLVDRGGALVSNRELMSALWEDETHESYFSNIRSALLYSFESVGMEHIFQKQWGKLGIRTEEVDCDLFDWKKGLPQALNTYQGEYMSQYSWGEFTLAVMSQEKGLL